ncbi:hypothetical protein BGZ76_009009 [Entomortierella beljakovae]|nr:hypothetical protein BGZ76_009009 [Entomortierella beljakovae]
MLDSVGGLFFYTASQWTAVAPTKGVTPSLRSSACMVAAGNDEMILFGGYSRFSSSTFNDLYILNTTSRSWRAGANVTIENGRNQVACAYSNGYLVIWGGVNTGASTEIMADITPLLYDFKADKWVTSYIAPQVPTSAQTNPTNTNPGSSNPTNTPSPSNGGGNTSMVAGVVGGLVVLLALGGLIFFRRRRRQSVTGVQRINSSSGLDLNPMYPKNIDCSQKSTIETEVGFASQIPHSNPVVRGPQTQTSDSVYYKDEYSPTNTFSQLSQSTPRSPEDNLERSQSSVSGSTAVSSHGNPQSLETPQSNGFNCPVSYPRPPQYGKYKSGVDTYSVVTQPPRQPQQPQQLQQYQQHHEPQQYHEFQRFQPQQSQQPQQSRDTRYNNLNANSYPDNTYSSYHA